MVFAVDKPTDPTGVTLESWAQGFLVGSLMVMAGITFANMRKHVLLHKLILLEVSTSRHRLAYIHPPGMQSDSTAAFLGHAAWHVHVRRTSGIQLVS